MPIPAQRNNPVIGANAERDAIAYLQTQGLRLITHNFRRKTGEIDLIMLDQSTLVFIEVKSRKRTEHGHPAEFVTLAKQRKIIRTAMIYLQKNSNMAHRPCRFDVLAVHSGQTPAYHWIPDAFQL